MPPVRSGDLGFESKSGAERSNKMIYSEAREKVEEFFKSHMERSYYPKEIAKELGLNVFQVREIIKELLDEGLSE